MYHNSSPDLYYLIKTLRRKLDKISQSLPGLRTNNYLIICLATLMKTVKTPQGKTVGYLSDRYRLGH